MSNMYEKKTQSTKPIYWSNHSALELERPSSWLEIDKQAIAHNIATYKKIIGSGTLAAVIKSNAYGHDQMLIASLCEENPQVDWLCVANLSDAVRLRQHGIQKPILVLSAIDCDLTYAARLNISIICYEYDLLEYAQTVGVTLNIPIAIHVKIDTGMSRFGMYKEECLRFVKYAKTLSHIQVDGIFTHFSQAHHEDQTFTNQQENLFLELLKELETNNIVIPHRHCANSAATSTRDAGACNFFRVGAGLYGIWPSAYTKERTLSRYPDITIEQALSWKTVITGVRTIQAGIPVGYDKTFVTPRITTIAYVPVGYYEGFDRRLSNNGYSYINGIRAPIIGRVCMNITLLDVTDIQKVKKGDEVTLIGNKCGIRPEEIAYNIGSFNPREILARINPTIKRILI